MSDNATARAEVSGFQDENGDIVTGFSAIEDVFDDRSRAVL